MGLFDVVLFSQHISVAETGISIGSRKIAFSDILGIKIYKSRFLYQIGRRFPCALLCLRGGSLAYIDRYAKLDGCKAKSYGDAYMDRFAGFFTALELLEDRAVNRRKEVDDWFPWRMIAPGIILQPVLLIALFATGVDVHTGSGDEADSFFAIMSFVMVICIVLSVLGFFWDRHVRKMAWQ